MKILIIIVIITLMRVEFSDNFSSGISVSPVSIETTKGCTVVLFFSIISVFSSVVSLSVTSSSFHSSFSLVFLFSSPVSSFSSFPLLSVNSGSTVVHSDNEIVELSVLDASSVVIIVESVNVFVEHVVQDPRVIESVSLDVGVDSNDAVDSVLLDNWRMKINNC